MTVAGRKSFSHQGVLLFNSLSEEIRNENSYIVVLMNCCSDESRKSLQHANYISKIIFLQFQVSPSQAYSSQIPPMRAISSIVIYANFDLTYYYRKTDIDTQVTMTDIFGSTFFNL